MSSERPTKGDTEETAKSSKGAERGEGVISLDKAGIRAQVVVPEGEGESIGTYLVHITRPGGNQEIRENRDGVISGAWLEDLDGDGQVELTVAMTSAGSGSYPTIHFFNQERQSFELHPLSDLTEAQRAGYMGHDLVEIKDGKLLRTFPRYRPGDPNASPSGGRVTLRYSFTDDAWTPP